MKKETNTKAHAAKVESMKLIKTAYDQAKKDGTVKTYKITIK